VFTWWSGQQLVPLVKAGALANMTSLVKVWEAKYGLNPDVEKRLQGERPVLRRAPLHL